ncbi:hypothetical protein ACNOYE_08035 [Nannocystaceae bacterium ST9]
MLPRTARPAACALLAALAGCAEEPSFQLAWRISDDPAISDPADAPALLTVKQCSEVGIEKVRLEVRRPGDSPISLPRLSRDYGCFPGAFAEGEPTDGPALGPGEYELELIGLRRNGAEWLCPGVDDQGNPTEVGCVRASGSVTVREGELPVLEFLLDAPIQCDDGVDNDRDGRVDGSDPACVLGEAIESFDAGLTLFQLSVGLLANPVIEPRHVGIDAFAFAIDGEPFESLLPTSTGGATWPWDFPLLDARLDAGPHTLSMVALDESEAELSSPLTLDFTVDIEAGAFVVHEFELGSADFLAPIEDELAVSWAMSDSIVGPPCGPASAPVDDMRIRVRQGDTPLALAIEDILMFPNTPLTDPVVEADDWLAFACDNGGRLISAAPLTWTETVHAIEIEGRIGGVTCYASGITPIRPGSFSPVSVAVQPVLDDQGMPPAGCE